jgi:hypothetical protein
VLSPEAGIQVSKFNFSLKFILGSKTPAFSGIDPNSNNQKVTIQSIKVQQYYFTASYRLFQL